MKEKKSEKVKLLQKPIKKQRKLELSLAQLSQPKLQKKQSSNCLTLWIASLKTKAEPASTFSALTNITICIPEQRRSNPKHNGKKNFALDKLVFWSSDSSSESISEEESVAWYCSVIGNGIYQTMVSHDLRKCWPW